MPSGKQIIVERVQDGQRVARFTDQAAPETKVVILDDEDHAHVVIGTAAELAAVGLEAPAVEDNFVEAEVVKSKPKPAAKKPAAKKAAK